MSLSSVLEINFEEPDYAIEEGSDTTCLPIILQFRKNQNPFTVRISSVTFGTAESLDLGSFINLTSHSNVTAGLLNAGMPYYYAINACTNAHSNCLCVLPHSICLVSSVVGFGEL